jgi:hypothetical protein
VSDTAIIIFIGVVIFVVWFFARKGRASKDSDIKQREAVQEANKSLRELNKSLGFPEGTGPTGIMVDGEYRVVNVGHTERMKNDPTYAFGNKTAGILVEISDLEAALTEAQASGDQTLTQKINKQLASLEREANELIDQHQRDSKR